MTIAGRGANWTFQIESRSEERENQCSRTGLCFGVLKTATKPYGIPFTFTLTYLPTMKPIFCPFIFVLILTFVVGCGGNSTVTGKVTFPDGTPLTEGRVVFETSTFQATGPIDGNGNFRMGSLNPGDGVPNGTYQVSIQGVIRPTFVERPGGAPQLIMPTSSPIDPKFFAAATSGLTAEITGRTVFNIEVTPP